MKVTWLHIVLVSVILLLLSGIAGAYDSANSQYQLFWGRGTSSMIAVDGSTLAAGDSFILIDSTNKLVDVFQIEDSSATADNVKIFAPTTNPGSHRWHKRTLGGAKEYAITYAATIDIDWENGDTQYVVLAGNPTINAPTHPVNGKRYLLRLVQDSTGSRTVTFASSWIKWVGNNAPVQTTTANRQDIVSMLYSNGTYFGDMICNFDTTN